MITQYLKGYPGLEMTPDKVWVDTVGSGDAQLAFLHTLLDGDLAPFALGADTARGVGALKAALEKREDRPLAVKGQVVGPFTQATALADARGRALYFDPQQREMITELMALRAAWQVDYFKDVSQGPVVVFIDEPGLAGFGSSAFIGVSREDVIHDLSRVISAIHDQGGIAGIHVCGNTDWGMVMASGVDVVNFDAFAYFDKFFLYAREIVAFMEAGGCLAWGMVPTDSSENLAAATLDDLEKAFWDHVDALCGQGLDRERVLAQSAITPACGMGSRTPEEAMTILALTRGLSERLQV